MGAALAAPRFRRGPVMDFERWTAADLGISSRTVRGRHDLSQTQRLGDAYSLF